MNRSNRSVLLIDLLKTNPEIWLSSNNKEEISYVGIILEENR